MHRPDARADLFELGLQVALDGPSNRDHPPAGPSPQVLEGFPLVFGQTLDGGVMRPGQVRQGRALPPAQLADERPEPLDLRGHLGVGPIAPRPRGQCPEDLLDPLKPEAEGLETLLGVGQQRPADVSGVPAQRRRLRRCLVHRGASGLCNGLPDPEEPIVEPFIEGPLLAGQDLLEANLPGSLAGGGLGDGDGIGETLPGRTPPRRLGDRRRWGL